MELLDHYSILHYEYWWWVLLNLVLVIPIFVVGTKEYYKQPNISYPFEYTLVVFLFAFMPIVNFLSVFILLFMYISMAFYFIVFLFIKVKPHD